MHDDMGAFCNRHAATVEKNLTGIRVHVIDGTFELFRAYFAAPPMRSSSGQEVGATRVFLGSLHAFIRDQGITHVACAFDHVIESFRNQLFDGYKTGEGLDPALESQFPLAEQVTAALGVTVWPMVEFEADDALATAAFRFANNKNVAEVIICSPDKDLAQCVRGDRVVLYDRIRKLRYNEEGVYEKFGVPPSSIPDYLALVGDDADGIPGLPRFGAKNTAALLGEFKKLESIPLDPKKWPQGIRGKEGLAQTLKEHQKDAALYKRLATLRTDVPLKEELDDLKWQGARASLREVCRDLGDERLLERIHLWAK